MSQSQRTHIYRSSMVSVVAALAVCMLSSCGFSSVSPFISGADVAYDPRLLGTWWDSEGKESAVVVREGDGYDITYTDKDGKMERFHGVLGRVGPHGALDVFPKEVDRDLFTLMVPTHGIVILEVSDSQLTLRAVDTQAIKNLLKERPLLVGHSVKDDFALSGVVLTAPTAEVRKFLSEIIDSPGVLQEPDHWQRK